MDVAKCITLSVIMAVMNLAGVTSKAGFQTEIPVAAICDPCPPCVCVNSFGDLSSITIFSPDVKVVSTEVRGAAT